MNICSHGQMEVMLTHASTVSLITQSDSALVEMATNLTVQEEEKLK